MEIWKNIPGYEGLYQASSIGRIRSFRFEKVKIMKLKPTRRGYLAISLFDSGGVPKTHQVHRLIALAFLENSEDLPVAHHKNNIRSDNRVENLEWMMQEKNCLRENKLYITLSVEEMSLVEDFTRLLIRFGIKECRKLIEKIKGEL